MMFVKTFIIVLISVLFCLIHPEKYNVNLFFPFLNISRFKSTLFQRKLTDIENMSIQEIRDSYLVMPKEEKRKLYACGDKYVTLYEIDSWADYFLKNQQRLKESFWRAAKEPDEFRVSEMLNRKVSLWRGNITHLEIDAIVNAANKSLLGGGGVDGAIHAAAGPDMKAECAQLNGCETGVAKITAGYKLPARYVIHTVGPIGEKPNLLESCYIKSLSYSNTDKIRTIAFPCISTGIYGYPQLPAAHVALKSVRMFLEKNSSSIDRVIFCLFLPDDVKIYEHLMQVYFPTET